MEITTSDRAINSARKNNITSSVAPWFSYIAYPLGRQIILPFYFGKITVTGRENLPQNTPIILAPTHRSRWDAFMIAYAAGRDITGKEMRFMVSHDEITGLQGFFVRWFGGFPVDTKKPNISSLRHVIDLLKQKETLVIFPEGNIFREEIQPLKQGLARMALQTESMQPGLNIKIVPISLKYAQPFPQKGCDVKINIGQPLNVADYDINKIKQSSQKLTDDLTQRLQNLSQLY